MKKYTFYLRLIPATLGIAAFLSGCNTMEGAGQDIQKAGRALEKSADKHK